MSILLSLLGVLGVGGGVGIAALLGGGPWMLMAAKWVWGWLSHATFLQVVCALLIVALGVDHVALIIAHRHSAKVESQLEKVVNQLTTERGAYRQAQAEAQAKNQADIQRTEQRQKEISDARVNDLHSRLERIARELRDNPSAKGSAGRSAVPETGDAPCRATDPAWLCLSPADRLRAAQNEERQDQLITWNEEQLKVDPNKR